MTPSKSQNFCSSTLDTLSQDLKNRERSWVETVGGWRLNIAVNKGNPNRLFNLSNYLFFLEKRTVQIHSFSNILNSCNRLTNIFVHLTSFAHAFTTGRLMKSVKLFFKTDRKLFRTISLQENESQFKPTEGVSVICILLNLPICSPYFNSSLPPWCYVHVNTIHTQLFFTEC